MNFITPHSYLCLLGPNAKNIEIINHLNFWQSGKGWHLSTCQNLSLNDLILIENKINKSNIKKLNFHYLSDSCTKLLSQKWKINRQSANCPVVDIQNLQFNGRKYHGIRGALNKIKKLNITIENNYRSIDDIKNILNIWSEKSGEKYFRDFSGKNLWFFKNNYHINSHNVFAYLNNKLIGFGVITPENNGYSSYTIGKSLCIDYPGLSEFVDIEAFKLAKQNNTKYVNMGAGSKKVILYKEKFPLLTTLKMWHGEFKGLI